MEYVHSSWMMFEGALLVFCRIEGKIIARVLGAIVIEPPFELLEPTLAGLW